VTYANAEVVDYIFTVEPTLIERYRHTRAGGSTDGFHDEEIIVGYNIPELESYIDNIVDYELTFNSFAHSLAFRGGIYIWPFLLDRRDNYILYTPAITRLGQEVSILGIVYLRDVKLTPENYDINSLKTREGSTYSPYHFVHNFVLGSSWVSGGFGFVGYVINPMEVKLSVDISNINEIPDVLTNAQSGGLSISGSGGTDRIPADIFASLPNEIKEVSNVSTRLAANWVREERFKYTVTLPTYEEYDYRLVRMPSLNENEFKIISETPGNGGDLTLEVDFNADLNGGADAMFYRIEEIRNLENPLQLEIDTQSAVFPGSE
jgi:hypothetical protein